MEREKSTYGEDRKLVQAVANGDRRAFEEVVKKYEPLIAKVAVGMLGNTDDADDVGQETFIRFFRSASRYKGEAALGTYLSRIAINLSLNELKKRKSHNWFSIEEQFTQPPRSEDDYKKSDTAELVNKALAQLEPEFRSVVVLRLMQGFSTKETAEILELPLGTVLSRLSRAQEKLRQIITKLETH